MPVDYPLIAQEALDAISEYGFQVKFVRRGSKTGPSYAPVNGASSEILVKAIDGKSRLMALANGVGERKRTILVPASGFAPQKGDKVEIRGIEHTVLLVENVAPGGVDVLFRVYLEN